MRCRHCGAEVSLPVIDLGSAPPSNAYLKAEDLNAPEVWFPLRVLVCEACWLVQTEDFAGREDLFSADYAYLSSISATWRAHVDAYAGAMTPKLDLTADSLVVEIAANDGILLECFQKRGIPVLGVEPTGFAAARARERGLQIIESFFGRCLAAQMRADGIGADLIAANNVLAHVPDINDFTSGIAELLKPDGVATFEFPHLLNLIGETQFDTIYHEHFSYLSLAVAERVLAANGLQVFDVEELPTHGGSLRVFAQRRDTGKRTVADRVEAVKARERDAGLEHPDTYRNFQVRADRIKDDLVAFLIGEKRSGRTVAAYGAAAKGNTLLNYAGVRPDLVSFVVDRNPLKQGQFLPGSRIPILAEDAIVTRKPGTILILPWNIAGEIIRNTSHIADWGGRFALAVPELKLFPAGERSV